MSISQIGLTFEALPAESMLIGGAYAAAVGDGIAAFGQVREPELVREAAGGAL